MKKIELIIKKVKLAISIYRIQHKINKTTKELVEADITYSFGEIRARRNDLFSKMDELISMQENL